MAKHLVIVESPAKAKTIQHYLGEGYTIKASVGHVRDLPAKSLGVDIEHGFAPSYELLPKKAEVVRDIRAAAAGADAIYLATDPDREGEAIAWHVAVAAGLEGARVQRIAFFQVTKAAVQEAIQNPRALDTNLIDAQQARRVLDRLVGYQISPLLTRTIRKRFDADSFLSAGRVQSIALRLVVEREREIMAFVPEEYWSLEAELQRRVEGRERFRARLFKIANQDPDLRNRADMDRILTVLESATYRVTDVKHGQRQQSPPQPFITSTLQATASSRLGFSPRQTMRLAQQLYEGIDLEGERVGLITYMRTDSPHVAPEAQQEARQFIGERWGADYLPDAPPQYKARSAQAQEAHEAIRPTSVLRTPEMLKTALDRNQLRLYELIWQRFLASQMKPALYATTTVDIVAAQDYLFRATGRKLLFPGFLAVYADDENAAEGDQVLPPLAVGEVVDLLKLLPEQHFTEPPPRYSEATLIKALEANGVGRPSTYATIVTVIQERGYVGKDKGRLHPTGLGMIVCDTLVASFHDIMEVSYTAGMEEQLDRIAAGEMDYLGMLSSFYQGFAAELEQAKVAMPAAYQQALWAGLPPELRERSCPQCGKPLAIRVSEAGRFLGCTGYPECRYILNIQEDTRPAEGQPAEVRTQERAEVFSDEVCDKCGGRMKVITFRGRQFLGCEHYPQCKNTRPVLSERIKQLAAETACPACGAQPLEPRSGRYGEYLHCPRCNANHSLAKLRGAGKEGAPATGAQTGSVATPALEPADCPVCGGALEPRSGRFGPYYRCPACKANYSRKKLAAARGESG